MTIAERLRAWRAANSLSQREAATKAGLSQAAWHELETQGPKRIGLDVAAKIVEATSVEITLADLATDGDLVRRVTLLTVKRERTRLKTAQ